MEKIFDMVIVGGGPGGYTAALYGARAGLSVVLLERAFPGGQMVSASQIDNYPGLPDGIDGISLGDQMRKGAERFGARTVYADVTGLELSVEPKVVRTEGGSFLGRTVVIATGASPRGLGLEKEEALTGRGVSYCAACDGMFFRDKTVVVVGGGNSAVADALTLSRVARKVILVHRRDSLRATKLYHASLMEAPNVQILWNSQVEALLGQEKLHGVQVRDLISGKVETVECDGLFISIGRKPSTELVEGQVSLDAGGYIRAGEDTRTDLPGVFAVGDVRTTPVRQIVTAVADGAVAAHEVEKYLAMVRG